MEMPRNLLERAKPELLRAIAQSKVNHPVTTETVEKTLEEEWGVSFLSYGIICDIRGIMWAAKEEFDINNPWKLFEER